MLDRLCEKRIDSAMKCEPAASIIQKFGGPEVVSEITGATPGQVRRWRYAKEKGGTGGAIPHWHIPKLMAAAAQRKLRIRAEDFIPRETEGAAA